MFILTVRNDRLGDLILALPTLTALRDKFPHARLGIVASSYAAPVLSLHRDAMEVWEDGTESRRRLTEDCPDAMLFLYPDLEWARAAQRARVPLRIGTRYRWHSWRFNQRIAMHRRQNQRHEAEYNLMLARPLLGDRTLRPPALLVNSAAEQMAATLLAQAGVQPGTRYAVLHPGTSRSARDWPSGHFARLASLLHESRISVVVTGSESERVVCRDVASGNDVSLAGATDIPTLAAVLRNAAVLVSCSTGPMHLAAAVGTPVVALFSANSRHSPRRWGPLGDGHTVLTPPMPPCSCRKNTCRHACMSLIPLDAVAAAVHSVIRAGVPA